MKLHLASTAELYAEHRRTGSDRKRQRIAAELQRRHDELNGEPDEPEIRWAWESYIYENKEGFLILGGGKWRRIFRFDFALQLPVQSEIGNRKSEILPS